MPKKNWCSFERDAEKADHDFLVTRKDIMKERDLLSDLNSYTAHADEIAVLHEKEFDAHLAKEKTSLK